VLLWGTGRAASKARYCHPDQRVGWWRQRWWRVPRGAGCEVAELLTRVVYEMSGLGMENDAKVF
jgi:hypothetical protein